MLLTYKGSHIAAISDTHGNHRKLMIPDNTEIIVHCGDACSGGSASQLIDFFHWFSSLPIAFKIFVAGNHDLPFELEPEMALRLIPQNVCYLNNGGIVINNIHFYSLSARPWLHCREELPYGTDVLITHGAPFGILDDGLGCPLLSEITVNKEIPIHLFGHIHSNGNRILQKGSTLYYNVAELDNLIK